MMTPEALTIETTLEGRERVLSLGGEIDLETVASLIQALRKATDTGHSVIVDLSAVTYMDSQGIRALRNAHQQALTNGGMLRLRGCHGVVDRVLKLVGLDRVIPIIAGESAAP